MILKCYIHKCHYTCVKPQRIYNTGVNPNVNYGLRLITTRQYGFVNDNKWTTLGPGVCVSMLIREGCVCMGSGSIWELSILSVQLCHESKTALKI